MGFERKVGPTLDFASRPPTEAGRIAGGPIARIVDLIGNQGISDGYATGFLVHGPLLVTNWHVFPSAEYADGAAAQFGFELGRGGLTKPGFVFELDPARFFLSNEELDIAIVGISSELVLGELGSPLSGFGKTDLIPTVGKILVGLPINIIQHPDGSPKKWAVEKNQLLAEPGPDDLFLRYSTDTLPGSSGAPAFNADWELVAVHNSGVPRMDGDSPLLLNGSHWKPGDPDHEVDWVANEGARVSKIVKFLRSAQMPDAAQQDILQNLLDVSIDELGAEKMTKDNTFRANEPFQDNAGINISIQGDATIYLNRSGVETASETGSQPANRPTLLAAEKKIRFDRDYDNRPGYDPNFLEGFEIPLPKSKRGQAITEDGREKVLNYHHYSLAMHKDRRFCIWAAANANYDESKRRKTRQEWGKDTWKHDPRILGSKQIDSDELYDPAKKFDHGHLVRRDDVAWGHTSREEEFGNSDSFHFTNCTPQHEDFNRAIFGHKGVWGQLENHIDGQSKYVDHKLTILAGPFLRDNDPERDFGFGTDIKIPIGFWKVIVVVEDNGGQPELRAYGFVLSQDKAIEKFGWEGRFRAGKFEEFQKPLHLISEWSGVTFPKILLDADAKRLDLDEGLERPLETLSDVVL